MNTIMKRLAIILVGILLFNMLPVFASPILAQAAADYDIKEVNFVFLHGFNSNAGSVQPLGDAIFDKLPEYISAYERDNPGIQIVADTLYRSYVNNVDIETWASNIASDINKRFAGKNNLVLIGHSMGGKAALYAVAHNIGNLAEKVAMVVTVNSPIKKLSSYYFIRGRH